MVYRIFYTFLILGLTAIIVSSTSWVRGYDVGYKAGFEYAIITGHVEVECKFQGTCFREEKRAYQDAIDNIKHIQCGKDDEDENAFTL